VEQTELEIYCLINFDSISRKAKIWKADLFGESFENLQYLGEVGPLG
jgi:hypothetical protein